MPDPDRDLIDHHTHVIGEQMAPGYDPPSTSLAAPAEQPHTAPAAPDPHPDTPDGAAGAQAALIDSNGVVWRQHGANDWRCSTMNGGRSVTRAYVESDGPATEVLLVSPAAGRVVETAVAARLAERDADDPGGWGRWQDAIEAHHAAVDALGEDRYEAIRDHANQQLYASATNQTGLLAGVKADRARWARESDITGHGSGVSAGQPAGPRARPDTTTPDLGVSTAEAEANVPAMQAAARAAAWDTEPAPEPAAKLGATGSTPAAEPAPELPITDHDFQPVSGHPDDYECTYRNDGTDLTYCGRTKDEHGLAPEPDSGPGWDRTVIDRIISDASPAERACDGVYVEMTADDAAQLRALLARFDLRGRMLRRATARLEKLEQIRAELAEQTERADTAEIALADAKGRLAEVTAERDERERERDAADDALQRAAVDMARITVELYWLKRERNSVRRDAAADALEVGARWVRVWTGTDANPDTCAGTLETMAAEIRAGTRPVPGSPTQPEWRLHAELRHPEYEYVATTGPRKAWDDADTPPEGEGWERNVWYGSTDGTPGEGWERGDYVEHSHWMRRVPGSPQPAEGGGQDG